MTYGRCISPRTSATFPPRLKTVHWSKMKGLMLQTLMVLKPQVFNNPNPDSKAYQRKVRGLHKDAPETEHSSQILGDTR